MALAKDGKEELNTWTREMFINVISGSPVFEIKADGESTYTPVDLTVSPSYPQAIVTVPSGYYRFTLSGGEASINPMSNAR